MDERRERDGGNLAKVIAVLCIGILSQATRLMALQVIEEFACFNTVFEIECGEREVIVFDRARYGRNDTALAARCQVPYQRACDVDVHFPLNRVCAGKRTCSLAVNTALFADPCGYEEFLIVQYSCVQSSLVQQTCFSANGPTFYDHGFLASPNYPTKYFNDADCHWKLSVQKRQRIAITIMDFELDVKKGGRCTDYLEISAGEKVYFKDCGAQGKQILQIDSSKALVRFVAGHGSLTQRGFFIYFEAQGPGCPDLEELPHGRADYFIEQDILYANVTCLEGFHFSGTDGAITELLQCAGSYWNTVLTPCVAVTPSTTPVVMLTSENPQNHTPTLDDSGSVIGIALGVVSAILLITLLLVLALYFHKRRRNAERKLDQWRFVINNLQENSANEENHKRATLEGSGLILRAAPTPPPSNVRKVAAGKRGSGSGGKKGSKKINNKEDEWQGCNLLTTTPYEDEDDLMEIMTHDPRRGMCETEMTQLKYASMAPEDDYRRHLAAVPVRRESRSRSFLGRSRDSALEDGSCVECEYAAREKARSRRDLLRHKRARSGQWDAAPVSANRSFVVRVPPPCPYETPMKPLAKQHYTQSAPDIVSLMETVLASPASVTVGNGDIFSCHGDMYQPRIDVTPQPKITRCATVASVQSGRGYRAVPVSPGRPKYYSNC